MGIHNRGWPVLEIYPQDRLKGGKAATVGRSTDLTYLFQGMKASSGTGPAHTAVSGVIKHVVSGRRGSNMFWTKDYSHWWEEALEGQTL